MQLDQKPEAAVVHHHGITTTTMQPLLPLLKFSAAVCSSQLAALLVIFALVLPKMFWGELQHPWMILFWTIAFGIPSSLFEYFYHRYLLHSSVLPFLGSMHDAHDLHHGLTSVKAPITPKEPAKMVPVKNEYPIEKHHQEEAMMFPLYSATIFIALFVGLIGIPLKWALPGQPIIISFMLGVVLHYSGYEIWHAGVLHLPYDGFLEAKNGVRRSSAARFGGTSTDSNSSCTTGARFLTWRLLGFGASLSGITSSELTTDRENSAAGRGRG